MLNWKPPICLRDGALLAAADGEYDRRELRILKKIASTADVDETELKALFDWVAKGWEWHANGVVLASCPRETIHLQNESFHDFNRHIQTMIEYPLVGADYAKRS